MGPLLLTLLTAAGAATCPPPEPGAARYLTALVVVGEPALAREVTDRLDAALRCADGFAPLSPALANKLAEARAGLEARCNAQASCLLERLPLARVERVVVATLVARDALVYLELELRAPTQAAPLARSARAAAPREAAATAVALLGRLLAQRDPVSEAFARRADEPGVFAALAERHPAWRHARATAALPDAPMLPSPVPAAPAAAPTPSEEPASAPISSLEPAPPPAPRPASTLGAAAYREGLARLADDAHEEAEALFTKAIAARPEPFPFALLGRGHARLGQGDLVGAEADYAAAFAADGAQAGALFGRAECARRRDDRVAAATHYRAFLAHPDTKATSAAAKRARTRLRAPTPDVEAP